MSMANGVGKAFNQRELTLQPVFLRNRQRVKLVKPRQDPLQRLRISLGFMGTLLQNAQGSATIKGRISHMLSSGEPTNATT